MKVCFISSARSRLEFFGAPMLGLLICRLAMSPRISRCACALPSFFCNSFIRVNSSSRGDIFRGGGAALPAHGVNAVWPRDPQASNIKLGNLSDPLLFAD